MLKQVSKYYIKPDEVIAIHQDNDVINIHMSSGFVFKVRETTIELKDVMDILYPKRTTKKKT
jgi:hypothetical protein